MDLFCGRNFITKNMLQCSQFELTINVHNHRDDILNDIFSRLTTLIISTYHDYGKNRMATILSNQTKNNNNIIVSTPIYFIYRSLVLSGASSDC